MPTAAMMGSLVHLTISAHSFYDPEFNFTKNENYAALPEPA